MAVKDLRKYEGFSKKDFEAIDYKNCLELFPLLNIRKLKWKRRKNSEKSLKFWHVFVVAVKYVPMLTENQTPLLVRPCVGIVNGARPGPLI